MFGPGKPVHLAGAYLGAELRIALVLSLDDGGTVAVISENVYLQYFCGLKSFQVREPFHPTVFVDIRKRMGAKAFDKCNGLIIERPIRSSQGKSDRKNENDPTAIQGQIKNRCQKYDAQSNILAKNP